MTSPMSSPRAAAATSIGHRGHRRAGRPGPHARSLPALRNVARKCTVITCGQQAAVGPQLTPRDRRLWIRTCRYEAQRPTCADQRTTGRRSEGNGGRVSAAHGGTDAGGEATDPAVGRPGCGPGRRRRAGGAARAGRGPAAGRGRVHAGRPLLGGSAGSCGAARRGASVAPRNRATAAGRRSRAGPSRAGTRRTCGASTSSRQSPVQCDHPERPLASRGARRSGKARPRAVTHSSYHSSWVRSSSRCAASRQARMRSGRALPMTGAIRAGCRCSHHSRIVSGRRALPLRQRRDQPRGRLLGRRLLPAGEAALGQRAPGLERDPVLPAVLERAERETVRPRLPGCSQGHRLRASPVAADSSPTGWRRAAHRAVPAGARSVRRPCWTRRTAAPGPAGAARSAPPRCRPGPPAGQAGAAAARR